MFIFEYFQEMLDGIILPTLCAILFWSIFILIAFLIQSIYHELGHMIFGLQTGYQFVSFRIGSIVLLKQNNKFVIKKYKLAGTGGQCLMTPPELKNGYMPFQLYNLGGVFLDTTLFIVFTLFFIATWQTPNLRDGYIAGAIVALFSAFTNGIPMKINGLGNDGYNVKMLKKSPEALKAFRLELKVNKEKSDGKLLSEMPAEWFEVPTDEDMKNPMIAMIGAMAYSRLVEEEKYSEAKELLNRLLNPEINLDNINRSLLQCDYIFWELIGENREMELNKHFTEKFKKFTYSMKNHPTVIRMEYAMAIFRDRNLKKAERLEKEFQKLKQSFPYPRELEAEEKLMKLCSDRIPRK